MSFIPPRRAIALLTSALCACGGSGDDGPLANFTVRDSAGIRIVEYEGAPAPTHSITLREPLFRHGHREGDYLFTMPWAGSLQPDGSVVIGDATNSEVIVIGPDGALLKTLATGGQGPAEVGPLMDLRVTGQDTVIVHDIPNRRVTVFQDGSVGPAARLAAVSSVRMIGVDSLGRLLMTPSGFRPEFTTSWLQGPLIRFDMETATYDTLAYYDWIPSRGEASWDNPYGFEGKVAVSGGVFVHGRSDRGELVWRGSGGTVRQITRWGPEPAYPTDAHWDALIDGIRTEYNAVPGRSAEQTEEVLQRQGHAALRSAVGSAGLLGTRD